MTIEFEKFFQSPFRDISNIPQDIVKPKLPSNYEKYYNIKVPQAQRSNFCLSKIDDIALLKSDKARTVVVINRPKYTENV